MAELRIELFGGFRVAVGARIVPDDAWRRRKPAALVKLLGLAAGHRLLREQAMDLLWPELDPAAAGANLRKAIYYARRALGRNAGASLIASDGELLFLPCEIVWVDVDAFLAVAGRARRSGDIADYERAIELYSTGLLPEDRYAEWAIAPHDELQAEFVSILEELAAMLEARGELDGAARAVRRLIGVDPLSEEAHAWLMRLHALAGHRAEALRQFEQLRRALAVQIGAEPGPAIQRLYEEIRARQEAEPELTSTLWERVGDLRVLSGDTAGAGKAFGSAVTLVRERGDKVRLHRKIASALLMQHGADQAEPHLEIAERFCWEPAERAVLECLRAHQAWERGQLDASQRFAEQALELARAQSDQENVAYALQMLVVVSHLRGDWQRGLELERAIADGEAGAQLGRVFDIHHCIGQYHLYGDGLREDVEGYARKVLALAEQGEAVRAQAFAWCLLGESLLLRARWEEAAGCLERSCQLLELLGTPSTGLPWQRLAELEVCRGTPSESYAYLRRASAIATVSPMAKHLWGKIHATAAFAALEQGDPAAAARSVRSAAATAARYGRCPTCDALLNPIATETFAALGAPADARAYAKSATAVAGLFESAAWRAMAESSAGSAAKASGDLLRAGAHFEAAGDLYEQAGQPYWAQRSRSQAAEAYSGNGQGTGAA